MVEEFDISEGEIRSIEDLKVHLAHRKVWMASSIHKGEEEGHFLLLTWPYVQNCIYGVICMLRVSFRELT